MGFEPTTPTLAKLAEPYAGVRLTPIIYYKTTYYMKSPTP